jgi:hypothetical protein
MSKGLVCGDHRCRLQLPHVKTVMQPNDSSNSLQLIMTLDNHPQVLQAVLVAFQLEGIHYLLDFRTTDKNQNNVFICRQHAKERAAFGKTTKVDVIRALHGNDADVTKAKIGEAQLQADITRARKLFKDILHMQDVQSLELATGEIKEGWERIRKFPFQGMNRFDTKSKLRTDVEDAVKDDALMRENHHEYIRRVQLRVSYSSIVLELKEDEAKQRSTEVIHMVVEHMPKEFEGAHQLMQQKFQTDSDKITFEVLKSAMQKCVSRTQRLKRQQDKRQAIEEVREKSVVPDKVDSLQQALISTMQQLPSKMQALVTSNNAFNERQNKGGGGDWQGTSNGGNHGGGRGAGRSSGKCWVCNKPGHFARECKHKKSHDEYMAKFRAGLAE